MASAVVQRDLNPLPDGCLERALRRVPGLTAMDARILQRGAYGILVERLDAGTAAGVQAALAAEHVATVIVDQTLLPPLPPARVLRKADFGGAQLALHDTLGRPWRLPWAAVQIVAAGWVTLKKVTSQRRTDIKPLYASDGRGRNENDGRYVDRETLGPRLVVQLVLDRAPACHRFAADEFNYNYLGPTRLALWENNLLLAVADLCQRADHALCNLGVSAMGADLQRVPRYPSLAAFEEEQRWLLWRRHGHARLPRE